MSMVSSLRKIIFSSAISLIAVSAVAWSQDEPAPEQYAPADTIFEEIHLTDEGVTAIDTAGYSWYYDFSFETFVAGDLRADSDEDRDYEPGRSRADVLPVEERCTIERKVKPFLSSVLIGVDEYVDGDVIAYGRVTIKGWVMGDVRSIGKRVLVTETGRVDGNIEAPEIVVKDGGIVLGEQIVSEKPLDGIGGIIERFSYDGMIVVLSFTAAFLFFGFLVTTLMPRQVRNFDDCLVHDRVKSYLVGFFFVLVMPVIALLMAITIVGIFLIPLLPLVYFLAIVLGVISFGNFIGRQIFSRYLGGERSLLIQSSTGILIFMALWFVCSILLGSSDSTSEAFGIFLLVVMISLSTYPLFTGIGAAVLTRFGFKHYVSWKVRQEGTPGGRPAPTPAPPPIPKTPPEPTPRAFPDSSDET